MESNKRIARYGGIRQRLVYCMIRAPHHRHEFNYSLLRKEGEGDKIELYRHRQVCFLWYRAIAFKASISLLIAGCASVILDIQFTILICTQALLLIMLSYTFLGALALSSTVSAAWNWDIDMEGPQRRESDIIKPHI